MSILAPILLACVAGILILRNALQARDFADIQKQLSYILREDTNALIRVPSSGKRMRALCESLNKALAKMREKELRLKQGDRELKEALRAWSHDLRTPLTAVSGYLELLSEEDLSPKAREYLDIIDRRMRVMGEITEELFAFALVYTESDAASGERLNLVSLVQETAVSFYDAFARKNLDIDIDLPEQPVWIFADRTAVTRVLYNLFSNALNHGSPPIRVSLDQNGSLTARNAAPQMDAAEAASLLGNNLSVPHFTKRSGTGILVVRRLMKKMGGDFQGTFSNGTLTITLTFSADDP